MLVRLYDTSALAKLYHREAGSETIKTLVSSADALAVISHLTLVELESILAIKVRTGSMQAHQKANIRSRLAADLQAGRIRLGFAIEQADYAGAVHLLMEFGEDIGLRTLDALHLAIAVRAFRQGMLSTFVTSDHRLGRAAQAAGCPVIEVTAE